MDSLIEGLFNMGLEFFEMRGALVIYWFSQDSWYFDMVSDSQIFKLLSGIGEDTYENWPPF